MRAQAIEVVPSGPCVTERSLSTAMEPYRERVASDSTLRARVTVRPDGAAFELLRGDQRLAEREFASLPARCTERVKAIAIALVLAFENAQAEQREVASSAAPVSSTPVTPPSGELAAAAEPPKPVAEPAPDERERGEERETVAAADDENAAPPEPEPESEPEPEPEPESESEPESGRGAPWLALHAGGGVLLGALPEPALLFTLGAGVTLMPHLQLELTALASPGVTHALAGGLVDAQLYGGQGALCFVARLAALRGSGCAGFALAVVPARGRDFAVRDRSVLSSWAAALLAAALELPLAGPISARVFAGFYGSLVRPELAAMVDGARRDATPFPLGAVALLQVVLALP